MYTGQRFGNYRLMHLVGRGGFADVYLGEHVYLKTQAAVKVLTARFAEEEIAQFRNEARLIMGMDHPHIIRILEFGMQGKVPFLVMPYASQGSLRSIYPKGSCLQLHQVVSYVGQVSSALQYIHDRKFIHRDVKPENMLVTQGNAIALSDFGIAVMAHSERSLRQTEHIGGTGIYMAPELFDGKPRTASDQYALAIVAYEWLTGAPPFCGSLTQLAYQHALVSPQPLRDQIRVSLQVERVILRALMKGPLARFSTVQDFARALEEASHAEKIDQSGKVRVPSFGGQTPALVSKGQASCSISGSLVHSEYLFSVPPALQPMHAPTKPAASKSLSVSLPHTQSSVSLRSLSKAKKPWFLPVVLMIGVLLLLGSATVGMETVLTNVLLQTSGPSTAGNNDKGMVVSSFLSEVARREYNQAYTRLGSSLLLVTTVMDFTRQVQADERCYGMVMNYSEVAHSEKMQNGDLSVVYTLTRSKFPRSYTLSFTVQQDFGSSDWLISSYGVQSDSDLGPALPTC
ncbi:serine/threonine protein kinase [Ktedonobacteria bacterium brp13]|nr:serine/threonine protein kinase [Ktedonobacteria bacterium brp13]